LLDSYNDYLAHVISLDFSFSSRHCVYDSRGTGSSPLSPGLEEHGQPERKEIFEESGTHTRPFIYDFYDYRKAEVSLSFLTFL